MAKIRRLRGVIGDGAGGFFTFGFEYDSETKLIERFGGFNTGNRTGVVTATHVASGQTRSVTFLPNSGLKVLNVVNLGLSVTALVNEWGEDDLAGVNFSASYEV